MSKRELAMLTGVADVQGARTKRRREQPPNSSDADVTMSDPPEAPLQNDTVPSSEELHKIKEQGLELWQTVKDAVNNEGRSLSLDFLRKPSKRQYPDYYELIKQPIALDDIKKKLDAGEYSSLEAVKEQFDLCFNNAKQYNIKDSVIWKDAKDLLKLVSKTFNKLSPHEEEEENGKSKLPVLNRLIKGRIQKIVEKTDKTGRVMSTEFMELPSRKQWPSYYQQIKKPQCLENIFKRIKRKEYHTTAEFAADMELVFSNAMQFNQDHTPIWDDAKALRDYFRQLMSDLPAPYSLPEYTKSSNPTITIKPQGVATKAPTSQPNSNNIMTNSASLLLRVPAPNIASATTANPQRSSPIQHATTLPLFPSAPAPNGTQKKSPAPPPRVQTKSMTPQPAIPAYLNPAHYPKATYPHAAVGSSLPPAPSATPNPPATTVINSQAVSTPDVPAEASSSPPLKSLSLQIQPKGRTVELDWRDGVKIWALRLAPGESSIVVRNVSFVGHEDDEDGSVDDDQDETKGEEEAHEVLVKLVRRRKGKGRSRTTRAVSQKTAKKETQKVEEIQVKLNAISLNERSDHPGEWDVGLAFGTNVIEVGGGGGSVWKIYVERSGYHV